jgi:hypothetical protein
MMTVFLHATETAAESDPSLGGTLLVAGLLILGLARLKRRFIVAKSSPMCPSGHSGITGPMYNLNYCPVCGDDIYHGRVPPWVEVLGLRDGVDTGDLDG